MSIFFAVIAFIGWGTGDIFGGIVARKIGGYSAALWSYTCSLLLTSVYVPFVLSELHHLTFSTAVVILLLIPVGFVPLLTLYEGIRVGNASLVGTISAAFGAVIALLSILFFGEKTNFFQILAIIVTISGIFLTSIDFSTVKLTQLVTDKGVPYALISLMFWGIYFTFVRIPAREIGWFWPTYFSWLGFLPLTILFMKFKKVKIRFPKQPRFITSMLMGALLLLIGTFSYNFAITKGNAAVVGPIASAYPVLFVSLSYFVFKDRLKKQQILGILTTLLGIILLSAVS
jgi:drug/metabolite transporter (DMT)-like permease